MTVPTLQDHEIRIAQLEADAIDHKARTAELERLIRDFLGGQLRTIRENGEAMLTHAKQVVAGQAGIASVSNNLDQLAARIGKLETK